METPPITGPLAKAHGRAARCIAADRKQAPEELGDLFEYLEEHFFDADLTVCKLEREGLVDYRLHKLFVKSVGLPVKRYLLRRKQDMAEWLLGHTHFDVDDVAELLRYTRSGNFSRDFKQWTGQTPERFRGGGDPRAAWTERGKRRGERRSWMRIHLTGRLGLLLPAGGRREARLCPEALWTFLGGPGAEEAARGVWELLRLETRDRARQLLRREVLFAGPELFELLSRRSRRDGRRNRRRGVELAELALAAVEGSAPVLGKLYGDLLVLAYARLGNALRLVSDYERANATFQHAEELWAGRRGRKDPRVAAELWDLKAALRLFERRFTAALELLDRSLKIAQEIGDSHRQVTVLLQRAAIRRYQSRPAEMLPDLNRVEKLLAADPEADPFQVLCVYQEKSLAYLETDRDAEARHYLDSARKLCDEIDHPASREQLRWIAGRLAARAGDPEEAERLLRQARAGLLELGDVVTAGLVALDLAILCHEQGRFADVSSLVAGDALPAFEEVGYHREARAAHEVLRRAVAAGAISIAALRQARAALRKALGDPRFLLRSTV